MLQIKVNKSNIIDYKEEKGSIFINGEEVALDISKISENKYHILKHNRGFGVEVIGFDKESKTYQLKINGQVVEVQVKDRMDVLMEKMGMTSTSGLKINEVKAPMPGLILDIKIQEGDEVNAGDNLLILEAMKMENLIKSPRKGTIKTIKVKKGQSVDKNQILLEFTNDI